LGFVTFASKGLTPAHYDALVKKLMGLIRSSVSCCSTPAQSMLVKAYTDPDLPAQKAAFNAIIRLRYQKTRAAVEHRRGHPKLEALPFNSGYFMSFRCHGVDAEQLRQYLLKEKQIGTIAIDSHTLRVAFSSLEEDTQEGIIEQTFSEIYAASETF
jgi:aspartate/methionine/tyrosine aminotransferase